MKLRHLPTQGGGPALTAFLGNNSQVLVSSISASLSQIKAGKARPPVEDDEHPGALDWLLGDDEEGEGEEE